MMQPGNRFRIVASQLVVAPAGQRKVKGIGGRELELDGAVYIEGFSALGEQRFESFVEVVMVWVIAVQKGIQRVTVAQRHLAREMASVRAKRAVPSHRDRSGKTEGGGAEPSGDRLAVPKGDTLQLGDQPVIGH